MSSGYKPRPHYESHRAYEKANPHNERDRDRSYLQQSEQNKVVPSHPSHQPSRSRPISRKILKKLANLDPKDPSRSTKIIKYHPIYQKIARMARTNFIDQNSKHNGGTTDKRAAGQSGNKPSEGSSASIGSHGQQHFDPQDLSHMTLQERIKYVQSLTGGGPATTSQSGAIPAKGGAPLTLREKLALSKQPAQGEVSSSSSSTSSPSSSSSSSSAAAKHEHEVIKRRPNYFTSGLMLTVGGGSIYRGKTASESHDVPGAGSTTRLPVDFTADNIEFQSYVVDAAQAMSTLTGTGGATTPAAHDDKSITLQSQALAASLYREPADKAHPQLAKSFDGKSRVVWSLYYYKDAQYSKPLEFKLLKQSMYKVGRDEQLCDIIIEDDSIQPLHGIIQFRRVQRPGKKPGDAPQHVITPYYYDVGSSTGSYFGNNPLDTVKYNQFYEILDKDDLHLGTWTGELIFIRSEQPISEYESTLRRDDEDDIDEGNHEHANIFF